MSIHTLKEDKYAKPKLIDTKEVEIQEINIIHGNSWNAGNVVHKEDCFVLDSCTLPMLVRNLV